MFAVARDEKSGLYLKQLQAQNEQLKHIRRELAYDLSRLRERHNELLKQSNAVHMAKQTLKKEKLDVEQAHAEAQAKVRCVEEEFSFSAARLEQAQADLTATQATNANLLAVLEKRKLDSHRLNEEIDEVFGQVEQERATLANCEAKLSQLTRSNNAAQARLLDCSSHFEELKSKRRQVQAAITAEEKRVQEGETKLAALQEENRAMESELHHAEERHLSMKLQEARNAVQRSMPHHADEVRVQNQPGASAEPISNSRNQTSVDPSNSRQIKRARHSTYRSPRLVRRTTPARDAARPRTGTANARSGGQDSQEVRMSRLPARSLEFDGHTESSDVAGASIVDADVLFGSQSLTRLASALVPAGGSASNSKATSGTATPLNQPGSAGSSKCRPSVSDLPSSASSSSPELQMHTVSPGNAAFIGSGTAVLAPGAKQQPPQEPKQAFNTKPYGKGTAQWPAAAAVNLPAGLAAGATHLHGMHQSPQSEEEGSGDLLFF